MQLRTDAQHYVRTAVKYDKEERHADAVEEYDKAESALRNLARWEKSSAVQQQRLFSAEECSARSTQLNKIVEAKAKAEKERGRQQKRAKQSQPSDPFAFE